MLNFEDRKIIFLSFFLLSKFKKKSWLSYQFVKVLFFSAKIDKYFHEKFVKSLFKFSFNVFWNQILIHLFYMGWSYLRVKHDSTKIAQNSFSKCHEIIIDSINIANMAKRNELHDPKADWKFFIIIIIWT